MYHTQTSTNKVKLKISCYRYSSLVYLRNSRPVLWDLELTASQELRNVKISVQHHPDYAAETEWRIGLLPAGKVYHCHGECPKFDEERLLALKVEEPGRITVTVTDEDGKELARAEDSFTWLAFNRWAGGHEYPELLAALTLPYDPAMEAIIEKINKEARIKEEWPGYTESAEKVVERLAAMWRALRAYQWKYALPPKSWLDDSAGQTVRTPSEITEMRCCTCLDTSLLMAACAARMGYNPFLVLISGHAFVGVQLRDVYLQEAKTTSVSTVRNLLNLDELIVFECTQVNADDAEITFAEACSTGKKELMALRDEDYFYALDVCKLWEQVGILPIIGGAVPMHQTAKVDEADIVSARPRTRMENWQLKLLDLSLRNPLLNTSFKGKNQLQLLQPDVAAMEDMLASGQSFRVKAVPQTFWKLTTQAQYGEDSELLRHQLSDCVVSMFGKRELAVNMPEEQLKKQIAHLYNTTRREMEESGANTLYIACGFVKWYRKDAGHKDRAYMAPLLLIPVTLTRPNFRAGYVLRGSDEESRVNMTLLELLKSEFSIRVPELEGELPTDASGLDVARIFRLMRAAIASMPGWEVQESCSLGVFSFTKYLMWKDLTDREEFLLRNPVVKQIAAEARSTFPEQVGFPNPATLDNEVEADKVFTPLSGDSSQLSAVLAAGRGKNFVLIGPPGTGKSQTITNMIAHCLGHGKSVLFVAEKAAALQVVYNRLKRVGLDDFCLELHSNKANKKNVLGQFKAVVEVVSRGAEDDEWSKEAYTLSELRYKLNLLPWEMHRPYADGTSLYQDLQNIARYEQLPSFRPMEDDALNCTAERCAEMRETASALARYFSIVDALPDACLQFARFTDYSLTLEEKLPRAVEAYVAADAEKEQWFLKLASQLELDADSYRSRMGTLLPVLQLVVAGNTCDWSCLLPSKAEKTLEKLEEILKHAEAYRRHHAQLSMPYPESALDYPQLDAWLEECRRLHVAWFLPRYLGMSRMRRNLRALATCRSNPSCLSDLTSLVGMREARKAAAECSIGLPSHLSGGVKMMRSVLDDARHIAEQLRALSAVDEPLFERLSRRNSVLSTPGAPARETLAIFAEKTEKWEQCRTALAELLGVSSELPLPVGADLPRWQESIISSRRSWRDIAIWNTCRAEAEKKGFGTMVDCLLKKKVSPEQLQDAVKVNFSRVRIRAAVEAQESLRKFNSKIHDGVISDFAEQDARFMSQTSAHIRSSLIKRAADISRFGTEAAVLQREISKQKAHIPLRKLMHSIPNITRLLKPCMLMSPLSVAQYLDETAELFDVVIFDEASQIPVWDAIGAIGRGRHAIIVGDPRQMPPTSFFNRAQQSEEYDETEQDMESILDECLACNIPALDLKWHYRSKAESLIAFSNANYYEGKLTTFPAPKAQDCAVRYHYTGGVYEPGSSKRINRREARALVEHVLEQLRAENFRYTEATSIGIVTFNAQQQNLIMELFEEARAADDALEPYFSENNPEAIFVKNLENVQGDERGVIYFSTTYGPDARGAISMNFGPLNLQGGERRLNVAITRARSALHVFTSLKPEDIDLQRTNARGAADFRAFLDYARRGVAGYMKSVLQATEHHDALADSIAAALERMGYSCRRNVGVSGVKVDLAVVSAEHEGELMAGIVLDGEHYAAAHTARDRDVLRPSVLRSMGWRLLHLWSLDWLYNQELCLEKLDKVLRFYMQEGPLKQPELPELMPIDCTESVQHIETEVKVEPTQAEQAPEAPEYKAFVPNAVLPPLFEMSDSSLRSVIMDVLRVEAPMKQGFLSKRLREVSLTPSLTMPIKTRIHSMLQRMAAEGTIVLLPAEADEETVLRLPSQPEVNPRSRGSRNWDDIPDSELLHAADLLQAHLKCLPGTDEHLRGIASYFGIARLMRPFKEHLSELLQNK